LFTELLPLAGKIIPRFTFWNFSSSKHAISIPFLPTNPAKSQTLKRSGSDPCVEQLKIRFSFQDAYKMQMTRSHTQPIECEKFWRLANQELVNLPSSERKLRKNALCLNQSAFSNFALYVIKHVNFERRPENAPNSLGASESHSNCATFHKLNIGW